MTVGKVKTILERALGKLNQCDDSDEIRVVSNTYFLGNCRNFLGISSEGYINLDELDVTQHRYVKVKDVDLCIDMHDGTSDELSIMPIEKLKQMCESYNVELEIVTNQSESGWPSFNLSGDSEDVGGLLSDLGFDDEDIEYMLEEAEQ